MNAAAFSAIIDIMPVSSSHAGSEVKLGAGHGEHHVPFDLFDPQIEELLQDREKGSLVTRDSDVGGSQNEWLIAFVRTAIEKVRRLSVCTSHDDTRHTHDIELEARRVEPLNLFVRSHQNLAALVTALLHAGLLVLDVVPGYPDLDKSANEVPDVCIPAVSRIGIGDDEWSIVDFRSGCPSFRRHTRTVEELILIGGEQGAHDRCCLVGHLAQRIAGQIGARVLRRASLGGGRPAAQVDTFDSNSLDRYGLSRGVRTKGGDRLTRREQFSKARVETPRRPFERHGSQPRSFPAVPPPDAVSTDVKSP